MSDLIEIKEKLALCLKAKNCLSIVSEETMESYITLKLDSLVPLSIVIDEKEMVLIYADEHDNYLRSPYKSDDEWIDSLCKFVSKISNCKIVFSYIHANSVLLSYKIIAKHEDEKNETLKKVTTSPNPFLRLFPKKETFKEITFSK